MDFRDRVAGLWEQAVRQIEGRLWGHRPPLPFTHSNGRFGSIPAAGSWFRERPGSGAQEPSDKQQGRAGGSPVRDCESQHPEPNWERLSTGTKRYVWTTPSKQGRSGMLCAAVGCGHVSGLRYAVFGPLALMQFAAWLPNRFTRWNGA